MVEWQLIRENLGTLREEFQFSYQYLTFITLGSSPNVQASKLATDRPTYVTATEIKHTTRNAGAIVVFSIFKTLKNLNYEW